VDAERDPRRRLIASVALAAFSTAVSRWAATDGREDLKALLNQALDAVGTGLDRTPPASVG
jgi:MftR C-terminal domain